jgi:hypothetical protein
VELVSVSMTRLCLRCSRVASGGSVQHILQIPAEFVSGMKSYLCIFLPVHEIQWIVRACTHVLCGYIESVASIYCTVRDATPGAHRGIDQ